MPNLRMESIIQQQTNNSESGYCKMPDGTLIQWGVIDVDNLEINTNRNYTITYPIQFSGSGKLIANPVYYGTPDTVFCLALQQFETYSTIRVRQSSLDGISFKVSWMVIGRWK